MILAVAFGLLLLGVLIGARGMRRLGASLRGPWRPGVAGLGFLALLGALLTLSRGEWWAAVALGFLAAGCAGAARLRRKPGDAPAAAGMSRTEAADLLGVPVDAPSAEVEAAFRRLVLKLHPDQGGTAGLTETLQQARRVLTAR